MKRVQAACLEQTIQFLPREDEERGLAAKEVRAEYVQYRYLLERHRIRYQIVEEATLPDGAILLRIKKQCNHYDIGDYFD